MPNDRVLSGAIFDVKPVDESGSVDVQKISAVQHVVNLTAFRPKKEIKKKAQLVSNPSKVQQSTPIRKPAFVPEPTLPPVIALPSQKEIKDQFEELLNHDLDLGAELAKIGSRPAASANAKPRYRVIQNLASADPIPRQDEYAPLISVIHRSAATISREEYTDPDIVVEPTLALKNFPSENLGGQASAPVFAMSAEAETDVRSFFAVPSIQLTMSGKHPSFTQRGRFPKISSKLLMAGAGLLALAALAVQYGLSVKNDVVEQSSAAVANLQTAQSNLEALDFQNASQDFFAAYASFSEAGNTLNVFGATMTNIIAQLPGGGSLKSAKNLLEVGQLLSAAGTSMTTALNAVANTGALADPTNPQVPLGPIVTALKKALVASQQQVTKANILMEDIDPSILPEENRASFEELKTKLPELKAAMDMSADYAKFFENMVNSGDTRYLIMFQNGSELRPTGGFPGTYGVLSFTKGKLESIFVDDVYNLDGQLKEHIIPPLQMQHIAPSWGMRDANWYIDFPTSARNIRKFYEKESGKKVDGVFVLNPEMIKNILEIVGPVDMPQYGLTLTSENVLTAIQDQVEYGPNRTQPKQIVKDFAPTLFAKIYASGSDKWLSIFNTLVLSMNQRDVMMNFNNLSLQSFVIDKGFAGQVRQVKTDYVMATLTNVKGSKTDAVTDTSMGITTKFEGDDAIHTLTISRTHNGGATKFGFYNKQNPAYVRVLVPEEAELISVNGNNNPNFKPLIDYANSDFVRDEELVKFETSGTTDTITGVTTYRESGRKGIGFWLITDAASSKTVQVTYRVPNALKDKTYELYVQKQPALKVKNFTFSMQRPEGLLPDASAPVLTEKDSAYTYSAPLENDLAVKVNFK